MSLVALQNRVESNRDKIDFDSFLSFPFLSAKGSAREEEPACIRFAAAEEKEIKSRAAAARGFHVVSDLMIGRPSTPADRSVLSGLFIAVR